MFDALDNDGRTLDRIVADGLKRIDGAVEGVISGYSLNVAEKYIIRGDGFHAAKEAAYRRKLQREHNHEMSARIERMALAPQPDWGAMGFTDIGNRLA